MKSEAFLKEVCWLIFAWLWMGVASGGQVTMIKADRFRLWHSLDRSDNRNSKAWLWPSSTEPYLVMDIYDDECIQADAQKGNMPAGFLEHDRELGQAQRESFRKAVKAGIKLAFGTDAGFAHTELTRSSSRS